MTLLFNHILDDFSVYENNSKVENQCLNFSSLDALISSDIHCPSFQIVFHSRDFVRYRKSVFFNKAKNDEAKIIFPAKIDF